MINDSTINVIIVEDDLDAVNIYKHFTSQLEGFNVIATASSGTQTLQILDMIQPDLILLDVFLPDMHGIELLREIRKKHHEVDVIMITAANDTETVSAAIRGGAYGYLIKPIIIDKLIETLNKFKIVREKLHKNDVMNQEHVDQLFQSTQKVGHEQVKQKALYPKGIDKHTLKLVRDHIQVLETSISADELSRKVGLSYSTMRRYLEYLVSLDDMEVENGYGNVGRPERKYKPINQNSNR
ncbi:response regulator [Ureibacillus sp. GCM10028918]|uniref:response regulator n=1 Tax=Ureibacillus sp. GCM10028918 TaxID=3273429 RepID=UPI00361EF4AC